MIHLGTTHCRRVLRVLPSFPGAMALTMRVSHAFTSGFAAACHWPLMLALDSRRHEPRRPRRLL
jgi:hypothetical protein